MESITLEQILHATGGVLVGSANASIAVSRMELDSRQVQPGDCFVAIPGERHDGHSFLAEAIGRGAAALLISRREALPQQKEKPAVVEVPCTIAALGDLALSYRRRFALPVVAITGSVGKTTTKELIHHLLAGAFPVVKSPKSFNNAIGVPQTIFQIEARHGAAVLEMGANDFGEIRRLAQIARPQIGVVTCVAESHLAGFGDLAGVARAKSELPQSLGEGDCFITNADDPWCRQMAGRFAGRVVTFGLSTGADVWATPLASPAESLRFALHGKQEMICPIPGAHNLANILAALAVARELGLDWQMLTERLASFSLPPMRMHIEHLGAITVIDDAYNANPHSMMAALAELQSSSSRKIAVLGGMMELGAHSGSLHRRIGQHAAQLALEALWVVGSVAWPLAQAAREAGMPTEKIHFCETTEEATSRLPATLVAGDLVLIKGSRRMAMEQIVGRLIEVFGQERERCAMPH